MMENQEIQQNWAVYIGSVAEKPAILSGGVSGGNFTICNSPLLLYVPW